MPPGPTPKEKQSPDHSNDPHKPKPPTNDGVSPTSLQVGVTMFRSTHSLLFFLELRSGSTPKSAREPQPRKTSKTLPQMEHEPQITQNAIPQAKLQPPTPIKLLFDFSLIYTVLHKAGNKGEQESPVPPEAFLPKHHPAFQHSQTDQKNARSRIRKRKGTKAAKF